MGFCFHCLNFTIILLLLLLFYLRHSSVEARELLKPVQRSKNGKEKHDQELAMMRAVVGSRPPRCERRCITCGHCEAVQVPAVPQKNNSSGMKQSHYSTSIGAAKVNINAREDDYGSIYKPLSWKCKCGDLILNP